MIYNRYWAILAGGGHKIRKLGVFVKSTTQRMIMIGRIDRILRSCINGLFWHEGVTKDTQKKLIWVIQLNKTPHYE